jgi:branched-chain amino acid transport system permease protein
VKQVFAGLMGKYGLPFVGFILLAAPPFLKDYQQIFLAEILIWGLFAAGFDLVFGYTGMLSFCQALFFGAGAYGTAYSIFFLKAGIWTSVGFSFLVGALLAFFVGYVSTRLSGHYFLIITIVFSVLIYLVLQSGHWRWLTGGYGGKPLPTPVVPLGFTTLSFMNELVSYYFVAFFVGLAYFVSRLIVRSQVGIVLQCIRENEMKARLIGYNIERVKLSIFVFAGGLSGLAGALYSLLIRYTNLAFFEWELSGRAVIWTLLGGAGTLIGPFVGAALFWVSSELLSTSFRSFPIIFGILLIVVVIAFPEGIVGCLKKYFGYCEANIVID